ALELETVKQSVHAAGDDLLARAPRAPAGGGSVRRLDPLDDLPARERRASPSGAVRSQRNPTALFGAGLIAAIPDAAFEAVAAVVKTKHPEIKGRVCRLEGQRIGRFGWKAQVASLEDFVLTACAVELGLEVPGQAQGGDPLAPAAKAPGLDL